MLRTDGVVVRHGDDLLGVGARGLAVASAERERELVVLGVAGLELRALDEPAAALLGTVAKDAALVLRRLSLERQLREAQRLESVGRLAAGVAHDFNNLLTAIIGYAELGLAATAEPGRSPAAELRQIQLAADRAATLTGQLLAFSRKQTLQPAVVDLNEVVRGTSGMLGLLLGPEIRLETSLDRDLGRVRADARQLENVIVNLALNARDAMDGGGCLSLVTRNAELAEPQSAHPDEIDPGSYVVLSVADTGPGIAPEHLPHVFEPFFTTKEQGRGVGLGLASVHGVVRQSGGYVAAVSSPGAGATFELYLPLAEAAADGHAEQPTARSVPRATILLVDDESSIRELVRRMLEHAGYRVLEAADGPRALELAASYDAPIDLLLADIAMPGMRGTELARRLAERHPGTAVLYMSGYDDGALASDGRSPLLAKPFDEAALVDAVHAALERKAPARAG